VVDAALAAPWDDNRFSLDEAGTAPDTQVATTGAGQDSGPGSTPGAGMGSATSGENPEGATSP
jgi:hypothetical protein